MQTPTNPMITLYQTQLEASRRFADALFSGAEKMDRVVIDATHTMITRQLNFAQAMAGAGDPQSAATTMQENLLTRSPSDAANYQKEFMGIFAEIQNEIGKSLQEYVEELGSTAASAALPRTNGHAGDNETGDRNRDYAMLNPMTSMFSVWESAFKEVAAMTRRNMSAVQSSVEDATRMAADASVRATSPSTERRGRAASQGAAASARKKTSARRK